MGVPCVRSSDRISSRRLTGRRIPDLSTPGFCAAQADRGQTAVHWVEQADLTDEAARLIAIDPGFDGLE